MSGDQLDIVTPTVGRGAWPTSGRGGTLDPTGTKPGRYYANRGPVDVTSTVSPLLLVGQLAAQRIPNGIVGVDEYAVRAGVLALQRHLGLYDDGLYGPKTAAGVTIWQRSMGLVADGVYGPASARAMFAPALDSFARQIATSGSTATVIARIGRGTIAYESGYDPGAVGVTTPVDLGLAQLNGPSHPAMTVDDRLDPLTSLRYATSLIASNLDAMSGNERDAIAAYNLGVGGARSWVRAGRPDVWTRTVDGNTRTTYVGRYIAAVQAAG